MERFERVAEDLHFVRRALDASTRPAASPSVIYFLWAVLVLVGFALVDFRADLVSAYWAVAGPMGFLASAYLGWRHARRVGQASESVAWRHLLHWGAVLATIALAILLRARGAMPPETFGAAILLLLALGYFTAGLHLDRSLLWVGLLMGAGYVVITMVPVYAWTMVGIALAVSLLVVGVREGRSREATT